MDDIKLPKRKNVNTNDLTEPGDNNLCCLLE